MDGSKAELVERHLALARRAAALVFPRVRGHVGFDDVVALANAGLAEAADRYDAARGAAFATFAWYRIHGTIVDGLRKSGQLPRRDWARLVALRTGGGDDALAMSPAGTVFVLSLEALCAGGFDAAGDQPPPGDGIDQARAASRLRDAVDRLPARQRAIVTKHYFEGKSLLAAGAELGLSKSWASRLHAQAVGRLRQLVDGAGG